jgi:hypothetical protein
VSPSNKRTKSAARKPQGRRPQGASKPTARAANKPGPSSGRNDRVKWIAIALVVVIGIAIVAATIGGGSNSKTSTTLDSLTPTYGRAPAPASLVQTVTSVPSTVFDKVGLGSGQLPQKINDKASGGKPEILFIGAEYCPFCAAERWAIVNALGRFGTWNNLQVTHSSATDAYPNTETFSFHGAQYASQYFSFVGVEVQTNEPSNGSYKLLQQPTQAQQDLWQKYTSGYPFLYFDGKFVATSTYDPAVLANKSHTQIATAMHDPNSAVAKGAVGTANGITAALCSLTNNQPANVCSTPSIAQLLQQLKS